MHRRCKDGRLFEIQDRNPGEVRERAYEKYCAETTKPQGNWGDGMRLAKLPTLSAWEKARERYFAIDAELKRRKKVEDEKL